MKTPFELAYRYVIPYIQRKLVLALKARGLSNIEIARKLGITPSAVTRYLKGERGAGIDLSRHKDVESLIQRLADSIINEDGDQYHVFTAVTGITTYALARKYLCSQHSKIDPEVDPHRCDVCPQAMGSLDPWALIEEGGSQNYKRWASPG